MSDDDLATAPTEAPDLADTVRASDGPRPVELPPLRDVPERARYLPQRSLGAGGMGEVNLELDARIGREVAIKRLRPALRDNAPSVVRFLREARVQGQLEHPSIVPVYDLGTAGDGSVYFTMKRIRGRTLRDHVEAARRGDPDALPRRRLLSAFSQVCLAVDFAHARGVTHRDLKPDNVMLGDFGEVYVLDWGLARIGAADEEAAPISLGPEDGHTRAGAFIGTPGYTAPEQARGEAVDARADVWSLGAVLFEILALEPMIARRSLEQMIADTLACERRPSQLADVPPELDEICAQATAIDRGSRLGSAREIADRIERYLDGDRDLAMRKARANEHAQAAERAADEAFERDDHARRSEAAREAGRALALDPENDAGRRTLLALLTRPPRTMPGGAGATLESSERRLLVRYYVLTMIAICVYLPTLAPIYFVDTNESWPVWMLSGSFALLGALALYGWRRPRSDSFVPVAIMIVTVLLLVPTSRMTGPFVFLPLITGTNATIVLTQPSRTPPWLVIALSLLPFFVVAAMESSGVFSPTTTFAGGRLVIEPQIVDVPDLPVIPILYGLHAIPIVVGLAGLARMRAEADQAKRELHVQRWQLEQLVAR